LSEDACGGQGMLRTMQGGIRAAWGPVWAVENGVMHVAIVTIARITCEGSRVLVVGNIARGTTKASREGGSDNAVGFRSGAEIWM